MAIITAAGMADTINQRTFNKNGSTVTLKKISETDWILFGDLAEGDSEGFVVEGGGSDLPSDIGQAFGGGFYAGDIQYPDGQWYKLIVADVSADISSRWKTTLTDTPNTNHSSDGVANTNAIIAEGIEEHPAASHCVNYNGGGYTDWYVPSNDELNEIHRNLGFNRWECPPDFQTEGPQAFTTPAYWTSTQGSYEMEGMVDFSSPSDGGGLGGGYKTNPNYRVRPVRRIPFTP